MNLRTITNVNNLAEYIFTSGTIEMRKRDVCVRLELQVNKLQL